MPRSLCPIFLVVALTPGLLAFPPWGAVAQEATPAPRFTNMVDIGGRAIGLTCEGSGSPTVVLIGGATLPGDEVWPETVDALSPLARICVFDRAGLGVSEPAASGPQTAADVVADLHAALEAAGEVGPYVPVGFSMGGLFARLYASTHPDEVAGLILVEGAPPGWNVMDLTIGQFPAGAGEEKLREIVAGRDLTMSAPNNMLVSEAQVLAAPPPPWVPTVMIVAGKTDWLLLPEEGDLTWYELEAGARFLQLQAAQARDLNARIVFAEESNHLVPFQQPEVMIAAIKDVVEAVRNPGSWATPEAGAPS